MAFTQNALVRGKYTEHNKRCVVTINDIRNALKVETFKFLKIMMTLVKQFQIGEIISENINNLDEDFDEDDEDVDDDIDEDEDNYDEDDSIKKCNCDCCNEFSVGR